MHKLANLSLANRALIALVTVFVMIFGVITTTQLKQELIPSLSIPTAFVSSTYQGASPQVVDEKVTVPVEQAVLTVSGLESTTSTSRAGSSQVVVNFKYGTNMANAQQQLQAAVGRLGPVLPDGVDAQVVTGSLDDFPVQVLSVTSSLSTRTLADRLTTIAQPELQKIDGVRSVGLSGAPVRRVLVRLDLDKLSKAGLSAQAVTQTLQTAGSVASGGNLAQDDRTITVNVGQRLTSAEDVAALPLVNAAGKSYPLSDVASVTDQDAPATSISRTDGKPSLTLAVTKTPEGNTVEVSNAVKDALPDLAKRLGGDVVFTPVFDQAPFITQSIDDLTTEGGLGLIMAVLVILLFLLSVRSTLVTAISIPVSVLITMIGLRVGGYSLNILTLGALTIAVGRVVDDSIVVIENIKRHLSYGEEKRTAILTAVREVAAAVTAATITTVAVFLPIGLVGGQVGELFRPFAVTVGLALVSSLLVSLTIVPVLAFWFLPSPRGIVDPVVVRDRAEARERRSWLQRGYVPIIRSAVRHPVVTLLIGLVVLGGTGALAPYLQTNFLGSSGQNTLTVTETFKPALSLDERSAQAAQVEKALESVGGVTTVQTTVGSNGGSEAVFTGQSSATAQFALTTDPDGDQGAIENDVRTAVGRLSGLGDLSVSATQGGGFGGSTVEVNVFGPDDKTLTTATEAVLARMKAVPGVTDVTSSLAADQPTIQVSVDRAEAAKYALSEADVAQQLRGVLAPAQVSSIETGGTTQNVVLTTGDAPVGLAELRKAKINGTKVVTRTATTPTRPGQPSVPGTPVTSQEPTEVALGDIATVTEKNVATTVARNDGQRSATVSLTPTEDNLRTVNADVTSALAAMSLPPGATTELGGVSADQSNAFGQLGLALLVAVAIVYVVMVATFKSLIQPAILLVSVPFAATGALIALLVTGTPLGVPSLIGLLMLVGIVVTNAIVLIDLVNTYRHQGQTISDALINGARQRLRPILMTAVATILALTPMALGLTGGGVFISQPLAIVVMGGLISSTLLTLILVPVLYELIERGKERAHDRRERRRSVQGVRPTTPVSPSDVDQPVPVGPRHAAR
ncbi:MAG: efflux RND transporter permease subunit [Propionibacteriaceae bacterium]